MARRRFSWTRCGTGGPNFPEKRPSTCGACCACRLGSSSSYRQPVALPRRSRRVPKGGRLVPHPGRLEAENPALRLTLFASLIKFDRFEWIVEKATELGVERIVPVVAERSEKGLGEAAIKRSSAGAESRWESSQQSRRARVPEIAGSIWFPKPWRPRGLRLFSKKSGARRPFSPRCRSRRGGVLPIKCACSSVPKGLDGRGTAVRRGRQLAAGLTGAVDPTSRDGRDRRHCHSGQRLERAGDTIGPMSPLHEDSSSAPPGR